MPKNAEGNDCESQRHQDFHEPDGNAVSEDLSGFALGDHELPGRKSQKAARDNGDGSSTCGNPIFVSAAKALLRDVGEGEKTLLACGDSTSEHADDEN